MAFRHCDTLRFTYCCFWICFLLVWYGRDLGFDCFWYILLREQKEKYSFEIRRRSIIFERAEGEVFFWGKSKKYSFEIRRRSILLTDQEEKYSAKKWAAVALPGFSHSSESPRWLWSVAVQPTSMTNWGQPSNFGCLSKHNLWDK